MGQHLNRAAYFVADEETEKNKAERAKAVRKAKAKILVEFESAVRSAKSATDLLDRVLERVRRLSQRDAPAEAIIFMDATATGEIDFVDAQHLLIAYMSLSSQSVKAQEPDPYATASGGDTNDADPS